MKNITAYKVSKNHAIIEPLSIKRDWMDDTWNSHAYHCFPISLTNQMGWGLSFPEDISFIWDGISDSSPEHVKILKGSKYAYSGRANATVSFHTGIKFLTNNNTSLVQFPVPNNFNYGFMPFSATISTSFFDGELPCAIRVTVANEEIIIKANTPIVSILPIDLLELQDSSINFKDEIDFKNQIDYLEYSKSIQDYNSQGKWSNFYRNATDHKGNTIGIHQVKKFNFKIINDMV